MQPGDLHRGVVRGHCFGVEQVIAGARDARRQFRLHPRSTEHLHDAQRHRSPRDMALFQGRARGAAEPPASVAALEVGDVGHQKIGEGVRRVPFSGQRHQDLNPGVADAAQVRPLHHGLLELHGHAFHHLDVRFRLVLRDLRACRARGSDRFQGGRLVVTAHTSGLQEELRRAVFEQRGGLLYRLHRVAGFAVLAHGRRVGRAHLPARLLQDGKHLAVVELHRPVESRLIHLAARVHIGAGAQQQACDSGVLLFARDREHEGRHASDVGGVHLGARVEQRLHDLRGAVGGSQHHRGQADELNFAELHLAAERIGRVDIRALGQQHPNGVQVARGSHRLERVIAIMIRRLGVCAFGYKEAHPSGIVGIGRCQQHGDFARSGRLRVRAFIEEQMERGGAGTTCRGEHQRRASTLGSGIHVGAFFHQEARLFVVLRGVKQRRVAELVLRVHTGAGCQQQADGFGAAVTGGVHQQCRVARIVGIHVRAGAEARLEGGQVIVPDELDQLAGLILRMDRGHRTERQQGDS